jgi:Gluconate 2-dehydrogenase subunit 3
LRHLPNGSCPARRASQARTRRTCSTTSIWRWCGLASLDAYCRKTYKEPFRRLSTAQQDEVIAAFEQGKASEFSWPSAAAFFNTVRTHTMEGMFADPIYGGNKDFAGWRLVGFPGGQMEFTAADMQSSEPFTRLPIVGRQAKAG